MLLLLLSQSLIPKNLELFNVIRQNMTILLDGVKMREIIERNDIIKSKRQPQIFSIVTFVSTFNPKNLELFNAIRQNMTILSDNVKMREIIERNGIIKSKRQLQIYSIAIRQNMTILLDDVKVREIIERMTLSRVNDSLNPYIHVPN